MTKQLFFIILAFCIGITSSFYMGKRTGYSQCLTERISSYQQEIDILKTLRTSQEYYIADEKRKNAAFAEVLQIEMAEK